MPVSETKKRRLAGLETKLAGSVGRKGSAVPESKEERNFSAPQPKRRKGSTGHPQRQVESGSAPQHAEGSEKAAASATAHAPPYDLLCSTATESLLKVISQHTRTGDSIQESLLEELARTNPRLVGSKTPAGLRLQDKNLLLDNPTGPKKQQRTRGLQQGQVLSGSKLRKLGLRHVPAQECRYDKWEVINRMWQQYAADALRNAGSKEEAVMQLDLHGCQLKVVRHKNVQLAGVEGIVMVYNDSVFHIVTQQDRCMHVPRLKGCEWHIRLNTQHTVVHLT